MMRFAPSTWWTRVIAAGALAVTLRAGTPALATGQTPPPPPGTERVIRIGPEALVSEDARGRVKMIDEEPPRQSRGQIMTGLLEVLGLQAVLILEEAELGFDQNPPAIERGQAP